MIPGSIGPSHIPRNARAAARPLNEVINPCDRTTIPQIVSMVGIKILGPTLRSNKFAGISLST